MTTPIRTKDTYPICKFCAAKLYYYGQLTCTRCGKVQR